MPHGLMHMADNKEQIKQQSEEAARKTMDERFPSQAEGEPDKVEDKNPKK